MYNQFKQAIFLCAMLFALSSFLSIKITSSVSTSLIQKQTSTNFFTPVIDGKINEWPGELFTTNSTVRCSYAIANDSSNLYIAIKVTDQMQQMKLVNGGTEVWIDVNGKKKKNTGIKFPIGGETLTPPSRNGKQPDKETIKRELRSKMLNMELKGFKSESNGVQPIFSVSKIKPVIEWNEKNELIYELSIPFSALPQESITSLNEISIGIFIKALKLPSDGPGSGGPGGGGPGGGGPGGGGPGGSNGPDFSQIENLTRENSLWAKYTISKN